MFLNFFYETRNFENAYGKYKIIIIDLSNVTKEDFEINQYAKISIDKTLFESYILNETNSSKFNLI